MSLDDRPPFLTHATVEDLERYALGHISEPQLARLEEHLLICPECQGSLLAIDEYIKFMKVGLAALQDAPGGVPVLPSGGTSIHGPPADRTPASASRPLPSPATPVHQSLSPGFQQTSPPTLRPATPSATREAIPKVASWLHFVFPRVTSTSVLLGSACLFVLVSAVAWRFQSAAATAPPAIVNLIAMRGGDGGIPQAPSGHPLVLMMDQTNLPPDVSYRAEVVNSSGRQIWSGSAQVEDQHLSARLAAPLQSGVYWVRLYSSGGQLLREFGLHIG